MDEEFWDEEEERLYDAVVSLYILTLLQGVEGGTDILPPELQDLVDVDDINSQLLLQSNNFRNALISGIHQTTKQQVDAVVRNWEETGNGDLAVLEAMLAPIFSENRADMISITEVTKAFSLGNVMAWSTLGAYASYIQWNTQQDERVCPECAPKDGQIMHISSSDVPPAHPRCRCWISPVTR